MTRPKDAAPQSRPTLQYRIAQPHEAEAIAMLMVKYFALHPEASLEAVRAQGIENYRVVIDGSEIIASAALWPMAQYFGGARIPCVGVAGLGVVPERRGGGTGGFLLREILREIKGSGVPLSPLYPATHTLYRRYGWERAGIWRAWEVKPSQVNVRFRDAVMRPATSDDHAAIRRIYEHCARQRANGHLDRPEFRWQTYLGNRPNPPLFHYVIETGGDISGYFIYTLYGDNKTGKTMEIIDYAAMNREAALRILSFISDHAAQIWTVLWGGGDGDQLVSLLPEEMAASTKRREWFLRILDPEAAIAARHYPQSIRGDVIIDIQDEVIPENSGAYRLSFNTGRCMVQRGAFHADVQMDVKALASLFAGYAKPVELAAIGAINGTAAQMELLTLAFAGPASWMPERF